MLLLDNSREYKIEGVPDKRYRVIRNILFLAYILAFFLGGPMLDNIGIPYASEGGSFIFKVHIYSILMLSILFVILRTKNGAKLILKPVGNIGYSAQYFVLGTLWMAIYGVSRQGMGGMAYVIDTLITPGISIFLLLYLHYEDRIRLFKILAGLLIINAFVAIIEYLLQSNLVYVPDPWVFRSAALMAHPLNNALILVSCFPLLFSSYRPFKRLVISGLCLLALFGFGARASTGLFVAAILTLSGYEFVKFATARGTIGKSSFLLLYFGLIFFTPLIFYIVESAGIGSRIFENMSLQESSVQTRFTIYNIFNELTVNDWVFGARSIIWWNLDYIIQNTIIENFWIAWLLQFGLIGMLPVSIALIYLNIRLFLLPDRFVKISVICFLLGSYINNALSSKAAALLFYFAFITLYILIQAEKFQISCGNNKLSRATKKTFCHFNILGVAD